MKFLKRLLTTFKEFFPKKYDNVLPLEVTNNETISRFLTSRSHYSPNAPLPAKRVKYGAFMPMMHEGKWECSVFRIDGLREDEVWHIGEAQIAKSSRKVHGRADIQVLSIGKKSLNVEPDNNPPRHANIKGWPEEKSAQKLKAQELALEANLAFKA
ncbi:MAG: hypothetical protein OEV42_14965 [Deltaproteobacteria bacterium]|nr:hypothetical protein [Deltaproteobacteria bacterium]